VTKEQTGFPGKEILADYENERGASEKNRRHFHFNPATNLYGYRSAQHRTTQGNTEQDNTDRPVCQSINRTRPDMQRGYIRKKRRTAGATLKLPCAAPPPPLPFPSGTAACLPGGNLQP
jgi:hypothetical protein